MLVKACLNGSRARGDHPALPLSAAELAADARRAVDAGAAALHVHPRGPDGRQTLDPGACDATVLAIRRACPGVPVGLSTGVWIEADEARRIGLIERWTERPNFVSVNFSEPGATRLCELCLRLGIGIEAGVWTTADATALADSGHARHIVRVLIEPQDREPAPAEATAARITGVLDHAGIDAPRVYHGHGRATWRVIESALDDGWDVRVGLEDTLERPDGTPTSGNAELVAMVVRMAGDRGLRPARPHI